MLEDLIKQIKDRDLRKMVEFFMNKYADIIKEMPPSLTALYHKKEATCEAHLRRTFFFANNICTEMNLSEKDSSILLASALLHDMGNYETTYKEHQAKQMGKQYETGWYRGSEAYIYHGVIANFLIGQYMLSLPEKVNENIVQVALAVSSHMGHWHPTCPQPQTDIAKYLAISDYLASRGEIEIV
jgi:HD superfamily phosphodiesterase